MVRLVREIVGDSEGVTIIEYALIGALIAMIMVGLLAAMGNTLKNFFLSTVNSALTTA